MCLEMQRICEKINEYRIESTEVSQMLILIYFSFEHKNRLKVIILLLSVYMRSLSLNYQMFEYFSHYLYNILVIRYDVY